MSTVNNPFPYFPDAGTNGYIYIGSANQDAQTNPIVAYRDAELTAPWSQPIRTVNGYAAYQGAKAGIFLGVSEFSITVKDSNGVIVLNDNAAQRFLNYDDLTSATSIIVTARDEAEAAASAAALSEAAAETAQAEAESARDAANSAAVAAQEYFPGARSYVPRGLTSVAITAAGSGGTNGTYTCPLTGDNLSVDAYATVVITGGAVTSVSVAAPGLYIGASPTAGLVDVSSITGLTGATLTPTIGYLKTSGETWLTDTDPASAYLSLFRNESNVATEIDAQFDPMSAGAAFDLLTQTQTSLEERFPPRDRTTGVAYAYSRGDKDGKVTEGIESDGRISLPGGIRLFPDAATAPTRSTNWRPFSGQDANGIRVWSLDDEGRWFFDLDDDAITVLRTRLGTSAAVFRGSITATDITASSDLVRGFTTQGAWGGYVTQRVAGSLDTCVSASPTPMPGMFFYGQSNAGGGGAAAAVLTTELYPYHAVTFSAGPQQSGASAVSVGTLTDIAPVADASGGQPYQATATAFAREAFSRQSGVDSAATFVRTDWYGGQPISVFAKGGTPYSNLMASIDNAFLVAADYGRGLSPTVVFDQGESGEAGFSTYKTALQTLFSDIRADILAAHDVSPSILFWQTNWNTNDGSGTLGVQEAQRQTGIEAEFTPTALVAPTYMLPCIDGIHYTAPGRMMQGELNAVALKHIQERGYFHPLGLDVEATRTGAIIVLDFTPPTGCEGDGFALAFDSDWVDPTAIPANKGFYYTDDSSSASISSVALTGPWQVTITLNTTPTGTNKKIRYALDYFAPSNVNDWLKQRGQLYCDSRTPSPFKAMGYTVPNTIRHYALGFEETV